MWCGCHVGAWYQVSPETMSSWPLLSTSKTPAASNSLRPLIVCCFHLGSSARADAAQAKAAIVQATRTARERGMAYLRVAGVAFEVHRDRRQEPATADRIRVLCRRGLCPRFGPFRPVRPDRTDRRQEPAPTKR